MTGFEYLDKLIERADKAIGKKLTTEGSKMGKSKNKPKEKDNKKKEPIVENNKGKKKKK